VTTTALRTAEAVELAHALVDEVASAHDVRVLFVKGPSAAWWGLRAPRTSADVDVLVDPDRLAELVGALRALGWHERAGAMPVTPVRRHSVTLVHSLWPCDLDLHLYVPGVFVDDRVAFGVLWGARTRMPIAGVEVEVPSRPASACILALHALRSPAAGRSMRELSRLVAAVRTGFEADDLVEIAETVTLLHCEETLAPFLRGIGVDVAARPLVDDDRRMWALMRSADQTSHWLAALRAAGWRTRPRLLWTALTFVDPEDPTRGEAGSWRRCRYRTVRLGRGLKAAFCRLGRARSTR
jgi:hypothetical protein